MKALHFAFLVADRAAQQVRFLLGLLILGVHGFEDGGCDPPDLGLQRLALELEAFQLRVIFAEAVAHLRVVQALPGQFQGQLGNHGRGQHLGQGIHGPALGHGLGGRFHLGLKRHPHRFGAPEILIQAAQPVLHDTAGFFERSDAVVCEKGVQFRVGLIHLFAQVFGGLAEFGEALAGYTLPAAAAILDKRLNDGVGQRGRLRRVGAFDRNIDES